MIASLRGRVVEKERGSVVIDVNGVGFRVVVPRRIQSTWDPPGSEVLIYTHLHVRENELALYGTDTQEELELFRLLLGVTGIGPKAAMSILSELPPDTLRHAIASDDASCLARVQGIGPKTANKIVFHLKDKVPLEASGPLPSDEGKAWEPEVMGALTALGYGVGEARAAIASLPDNDIELEERLRLALRYFVR